MSLQAASVSSRQHRLKRGGHGYLPGLSGCPWKNVGAGTASFVFVRSVSDILGQDLLESVLFLVFDSGNRDVPVGEVTESCDVAAIPKMNDGFAVVHLPLYGAESFRHDGNLLKRITNNRNSPLRNIFVLRGEEVIKPLEVCNGLC